MFECSFPVNNFQVLSCNLYRENKNGVKLKNFYPNISLILRMSNFLSNFFFLQLLHFLKCWKRERIIFISPQDIFSQIFLTLTKQRKSLLHVTQNSLVMLFRATPRIAILSRDNFANFVINTFVKWFLSSRKISLLFYFILSFWPRNKRRDKRSKCARRETPVK